MANLKSICRVIIDGNWIESKDQSQNGIRLIQTGNIGIGEYLDKIDRAKFISNDTFERLNCTEIFPGDILISRLPDPIGRACVVPQYVGKAITAVDCTIVRLENLLCDTSYFINYTQSQRYANELSKFLAGTTRTRISRKNLERIEIPLPSLDEQRKIAAVLDKVSDLIAKHRQQLDKLDELVKSRFIEMFGEPENNNKAWPVKSLDKLCTVGSSKRVYQNEQSSEGVPFWRISDLVSKIDTGTVDSALFISEIKYTELKRAGLVPVTGDILVTSRGTLGRCYTIQDEDCFYFQDGMISWLSNYSEEITPQYLQYLFTMSGFRKQIDNTQAGSTVAYLSIAMLKKLQVMVPDKALQKQFAAFVEQTDKSKLAIKQSLEKLETLKKSLMQQYFG